MIVIIKGVNIGRLISFEGYGYWYSYGWWFMIGSVTCINLAGKAYILFNQDIMAERSKAQL